MPDTIAAQMDVWAYGKDSKEGGRATQEDRCAIAEFITADGQTALLAMVADGIGGRTTGELASQWAAETIPQRLQNKPPATSEIPQALSAGFQAAHERIYDEAAENPSRAGMGTTCTVVVIVGRRLYLAHVGDSRAYVVRGDRLHQLSIDHTWAEEALAAGRSPEEIRTHPNRGVIKRYLGINEEIDVDTRYRPFNSNSGTGPVDSAEQPFVLEDGDRLLLCTDGVSDVLAEGQMLVALRGQPAAGDQAASAVVRAALKAHAQDNVTAVVVDLPGGAPIAAGRRVPVWAIGGLAGLLLLFVGVIAGVVASRPPQPAPLPVTVAPTAALVSAPTATDPTRTPTKATEPPITTPVSTLQEAVPTATPQVTTGGATVTPIATFTSAPTVAPPPSPAPQVSPVLKTPNPPVLINKVSAPILREPPDNETRNGTVEFKWQPNGPLPSGAAYEVVWWQENADSKTAKGFADPITDTSLKVNLDGFFTTSQTVRWTVLIVNAEPYNRLTQASESSSQRLVYQPANQGSGTTSGEGKP